MELQYIKCHCKKFRFSLRGKTTCPTNFLGYEVGKCPICQCTCKFYTDVNSYCNIHALSIMDVDAPEPVIPRDAARAWLDTSKSVSNLTSIASTNHFQRQIACGNMAPGTNYSLQASNDGGLGQSLYM